MNNFYSMQGWLWIGSHWRGRRGDYQYFHLAL